MQHSKNIIQRKKMLILLETQIDENAGIYGE